METSDGERNTPRDDECWDSPGSVISYVRLAAAAVTGPRPDLGDSRKDAP